MDLKNLVTKKEFNELKNEVKELKEGQIRIESDIKDIKSRLNVLDEIHNDLTNIWGVVNRNRNIAEVQSEIYQGIGAEYIQAAGKLREAQG